MKSIEELENTILMNLEEGWYDTFTNELWTDGPVITKVIRNGVPSIYTARSGSKLFNNREAVRKSGNVSEEHFLTREEKLFFFQKAMSQQTVDK